MTNYSALETASNNPLANLKFIAEDTVIYVSPTGNDGTGDGTVSNPYRTFAYAMDRAREYIIIGNNTLTVRLLRGEYTLSGSVDLYHPQGSNLIIEGDPAEFKQRIVHSVKNYTWSVDNFSGGGHGLTLGLWDGTTTGTPTIHGLTTTDNGSYFTITNAALGCRTVFNASGIANTVSNYSDTFFGDRFFNHGYSYEYSNAILGIGRIARANSNNTEIQVWTHNLGYDGRCPAWDDTGGLNNSLSWGGIANNYPETQYSTPNGYYGNPSWTSPAANNTAYPAKGAVPHITDDVIMMSTYPVVIRADYINNTGSLYLKNGNLKALRNILFMGDAPPFVPSSGSTAGATANVSMSISAFSKQSDVHQYEGRQFRTVYEASGTGVYLENANVAIRHLGFSGVGTAISCYGSKITKYSNETINVTTPNLQQTNYIAVFGDLDNSPVLCASKCQYGIVAKNSEVLLSDSSGTINQYRVDLRESGVHISARQKGVVLFNSSMDATSMWVEMSSLVPNFKIKITIPEFPGTTSEGNTAAFIRHASSDSFWNAYPRAEMFLQPSGASEQRIGYINYVTFGGFQTPRYGTPANITGITTGAANFASSGTAVPPSAYGGYQIHGILTTPGGLSFMRSEDIWNGICAGTPGGTLSLRFYSNNSGTVLSSELSIGKSAMRIRGGNGQIFGLNGLAVGSDSRQLSGAAFVWDYKTHGTSDTYGGEYPNHNATGVHLDDGSKLTVEKILTVNNGGCPAVYVTNQSTLCIGQGQNPQGGGFTTTTYSLNAGPTNFSGALCITGYAARALEINSSEARIAALFVKHPGALNPDPLYQTEFTANNVPPLGRALHATHNSKVFVNEMFVLGLPGHSDVQPVANIGSSGLFTSRTARYGYNTPRSSVLNTRMEYATVYADNGSSILLGVNGISAGYYSFAFDGGTANYRDNSTTINATYRNHAILAADTQSIILVSNVASAIPHPSTTDWFSSTSNLLSGRVLLDTRSGNNRIIATRSRNAVANTSIYNTTGVIRPWLGPENFTTAGGGNAGVAIPNQNYTPINIPSRASSVTGNGYSPTPGQNHVTTQGGRYDFCSIATTPLAAAASHSVSSEYGVVDVQQPSR